MPNETNTPKPLAAILAEMRDERIVRIEDADATRCLLHNLADRIEAAATREREETRAYFEKLHDGPSMICTAKDCAVRNAGIALAAPARNCDTVRDGREALGRCRESVAVERDAAYDRGMRDAIRWLLAPAEKGAEK